jgi:hypothetical protein
MSVFLAPRSAYDVVAGGYVLGTGRTVPTVLAVLGLVSVVVGARALFRSGRGAAAAALTLGSISAILGGVHAANAAGGFGTGNGLAGAVLAVVLGLGGLVLGALSLARSRRAASASKSASPARPR